MSCGSLRFVFARSSWRLRRAFRWFWTVFRGRRGKKGESFHPVEGRTRHKRAPEDAAAELLHLLAHVLELVLDVTGGLCYFWKSFFRSARGLLRGPLRVLRDLVGNLRECSEIRHTRQCD